MAIVNLPNPLTQPPTQIEPYEGLYKPLVSLNKALFNHELDTWGKPVENQLNKSQPWNFKKWNLASILLVRLDA